MQLRGEWELHLRKAERAYQQLKEDTALSNSDPNVLVLTFDLQQSLPTPVLTTNLVYYKRQLWTYNLSIHDCRSGLGHMHLWHEGIASRGSHEVGSCILKHMSDTNPSATHLITFSDSCGGQNRNVYLLSLWLYIVASEKYPFTTIDQKFMTVGHSYLPNDRDFGPVETARRKASHLYVPHDWTELIKNARRQNPFSVTEMTPEDFVSFVGLSKAFVNRKVNTRKQKFSWLNIRWIRVTKDRPLEFQYRCSLNTLEAWKTVSLKRKSKGRPPNLGLMPLPQLYSSGCQIKQSKKKDLADLMNYVPPVYHTFYHHLVASGEDNEESGEDDEENGESDEENGESDQENGESNEENGESDEENQGSNEESDGESDEGTDGDEEEFDDSD